ENTASLFRFFENCFFVTLPNLAVVRALWSRSSNRVHAEAYAALHCPVRSSHNPLLRVCRACGKDGIRCEGEEEPAACGVQRNVGAPTRVRRGRVWPASLG